MTLTTTCPPGTDAPPHTGQLFRPAAARWYRGQAAARPRWATAADELRETLGGTPPRLSPKFLYDDAGCALYEQLCALPEYYPPRVEKAILDRHEAELVAALPSGAELVDVGSGDGLKARRWLQAGLVQRYIGLDIAEDWLRQCLARGQQDFPTVQFDGVVTDLTWGFQLPAPREHDRPRLLCYPGSSIGNFEPDDALRLLHQMRCTLRTGDVLLLGADGPSDAARMVRAYDDDAGVTAAFNLNLVQVVNRHLDTAIEVADLAHRAVFNPQHSRIEMHLVARRPLDIALGQGRRLRLEAGQAIVTEHSYKHPPARMTGLLRSAGFAKVQRFGLDEAGYGVYLCRVGDDG